MTNDAKLGMLAGVIGVIVAAVFFTKQPPPPLTVEPQVKQPQALQTAMPTPPSALGSPAATTVVTPPEARPAALPSTPVVRTRKDVDAQPTSRQPGIEEEP